MTPAQSPHDLYRPLSSTHRELARMGFLSPKMVKKKKQKHRIGLINYPTLTFWGLKNPYVPTPYASTTHDKYCRPRWVSWMRVRLVIRRLWVRPLRICGRQHSFVEIDHEISCTVILSLALIQEGQLSVSG